MQNYQKISLNIKCPVCCTNEAHLLWSVSSKQAAQHFILKEKQSERFLKLVSHIESLWGQDSCEVVQCNNCGFCYSNPYVAGDMQFYTLAYDRSGYPTWKWEYQITYETLKMFLKPEATLLEIGAGDGAFVKRISNELLPKENIICTEFSGYGRQKIEELGLKCFSDDFRYLHFGKLKGNFDVVCMFQVLEHLDRLDAVFQKLYSLMKKGGSLFIAVPNHKRIEFNELNGALLDMPPNHIGRWNKLCFEKIGKQYGFYVEKYKVENFSFFQMAKQFTMYRFLRKSQQSGTFENYLQRIKNPYLFRKLQLISMAVDSIITIPTVMKKGFSEGDSQWVHLIKIKE